jgi:hypothetical protein
LQKKLVETSTLCWSGLDIFIDIEKNDAEHSLILLTGKAHDDARR